MLPVLASVSDLAALVDNLDVAAGSPDVARAGIRLRQASSLVRKAAAQDFMTTDDPPALAPIPEIVWTITLESAKRAWDNPTGLSSFTVDDYTERAGVTGIMLTEAEEALLARLRPASTSTVGGLGTVQTTRDSFDPFLDTVWVMVEGQDASQQFPLYPAEGPLGWQ